MVREMPMYSNESGEPVNPLDADLEALKVHVMNSEVVLLGPRVAVALSADAAAETARRLAAAAAQASRTGTSARAGSTAAAATQ